MNERVKEALSKGLSNHGLKAKSSKKKGTKLLNKTSDSTPHTDTQVALVESIINKLKCIGMIYMYIYIYTNCHTSWCKLQSASNRLS